MTAGPNGKKDWRKLMNKLNWQLMDRETKKTAGGQAD